MIKELYNALLYGSVTNTLWNHRRYNELSDEAKLADQVCTHLLKTKQISIQDVEKDYLIPIFGEAVTEELRENYIYIR